MNGSRSGLWRSPVNLLSAPQTAMLRADDPANPAPAGAMQSALMFNPVGGLKKQISLEMSDSSSSPRNCAIESASILTLRSFDSMTNRESSRVSTRHFAYWSIAKLIVCASSWKRYRGHTWHVSPGRFIPVGACDSVVHSFLPVRCPMSDVKIQKSVKE